MRGQPLFNFKLYLRGTLSSFVQEVAPVECCLLIILTQGITMEVAPVECCLRIVLTQGIRREVAPVECCPLLILA